MAFIRQAVEEKLTEGGGAAVKLDAQTLAILAGVIAVRAKGRADRGLDLEPLSRAQAVRRLLEDRISFRPREAVAILKLATAG